jgi:hypothetical protein
VSVKRENRTDKETYKSLPVAFAALAAKQLFFSLFSCALLFKVDLICFDLEGNGRQAGKDSYR